MSAGGRAVPAVVALVLGLLLTGGGLLVGCGATAAGHAPPSRAARSGPAGASSTDPASGLAWVELSALPPQAAHTVTLIDRGGPFPYAKDGTVFRNAEGILPDRPRGYYHEYTVPTPGESDRGARRIVAGRGGALYWTGDHYAGFRRIRR